MKGLFGWFEPRFFSLWVLAALIFESQLVFSQETSDQQRWLNELVRVLSEPADQVEDAVFVPPPREQLRPMLQAARSFAKQDFRRGIELLGEMLDDEEFEDFLLPDPDDASRAISMRHVAMRMLLSAPEESLEGYRLRYGAAAEQALDSAVRANDLKAISQVSQKYFLTEAGWEACLLVGHDQLQQGNPLAAANSFQRLVDYLPARKAHDPQAALFLAISRLLAGQTELAQSALSDLLVRIPADRRAEPFSFGEQNVTLPADNVDKLAWLADLVGKGPLVSGRAVQQWLLVRGNPERNAASTPGLPLPLPDWSLPTNLDPEMARVVRGRLQGLIQGGATTIPSVQPLALGNHAVMRTFDQMIAVDLLTGQRVWFFPPEFSNSVAARNRSADALVRQDINASSFEQRYWRDSVYGQASSDGDMVYVVPQPGFVGEATQQLVLPGGQMIPHPLSRRAHNELKAIDLSREGAVKWEIGGADGLDEPELKDAFFLGPPLPLEGRLYAICHHAGVIRLVALDALTGKLIWGQQLASSLMDNATAELTSARLGGATPSYSEGVLVCPTGLGALVAIDLGSQSAIWARRFGNGKVVPFMPQARSHDNLIDGLWRDSTIVIDQGVLAYTPMDSQELISLDLMTGEQTPAHQTAREDSLYVGCMEAGNVILIGKNNIRAISLASGNTAWSLSLGDAGHPSGRGYFSTGRYYLPTTQALVLEIDLTAGKIMRRVQVDRALGNLICHKGLVLSQGVDHFAAYPQDTTSEALIEAAQQSGNWTPELYCLAARVNLANGDIAGGLKAAITAFSMDANNSVTDVLKQIAITAGRKEPHVAMRELQRLDRRETARLEPDVSAALVDGYLNLQEWKPAAELLARTLSEFELHGTTADSWLSFSEGNPLVSTRIRLDRFLRTRLARFFQTAPEALTSDLRNSARVWFAGQQKANEQDSFQAAELVGLRNLDDATLEHLVDQLLAARQELQADLLLRELMIRSDPVVAARAGLKLTNLLNQNQFGFASRRVLQQVDKRNLISDEQVELYNRLNGDFQLPKGDSARVAWNRGAAEITASRNWREAVKFPVGFQMPASQISIPAIGDDFPAGSRLWLDHSGKHLLLTDSCGRRLKSSGFQAADSNVRAEFETGIGRFDLTSLRQVDRVGVLLSGNWVAGFDPYRLTENEIPVRWKVELSVEGDDGIQSGVLNQAVWGRPDFSGGVPGLQSISRCWPSSNGVALLETNCLVLLDWLTGDRVWERTLTAPGNMTFGDGNQVCLWNEHQRTIDVIDLSTLSQLTSYVAPMEWGFVSSVLGSKVVFSAANQSQQTLRCIDLPTKSEVWFRTFSRGTRSYAIDTKTLGLLQPNGQFEVVEIGSGSVRLKCQLPFEKMTIKELSRFSAHLVGENILIQIQAVSDEQQARFRGEVQRGKRRLDLMELSYPGSLMYGYLCCVDAKTGKTCWPQPFRLEHFQIVDVPGGEFPLAIIGRRVDVQSEHETSYYLQFSIIDLRTGEESSRVRVPYAPMESAILLGIPEKQEFYLGFSEVSFRIRMLDEARPPRFARELTLQNSLHEFDLPGPARATDTARTASAPETRDDIMKRFAQEQEQLESLKREFEEELRKRVPPNQKQGSDREND